ncbi:MAG: CrcB family protein [Gemmatimonadota bacterium]
MLLLVVFAGGAAGALGRFVLSPLVQRRSRGPFPWGTLAVNLSGSLLLGLAVPVLSRYGASAETTALVTVGLLGAFTTFSTFAAETFALGVAERRIGAAAAYVFATLLLGLLAIAGGGAIASSFL